MEHQGAKISIQGYRGCFHEQAARQFWGLDTEMICCDTFKEVVNIAGNKTKSDGGTMAIENSIAGSILPNYNLLKKSNLRIIGEVYLTIKQNLMTLPGVALEDIREVHSHPMALLQCSDFLDKHNWKLVESEDTALSAQKISQNKSKTIAAIASVAAAEIHGLDIVAPEINTMKKNYTRFLMLKRADQVKEVENANKASIFFYTDHTKGSLAKVLTKIAENDANLSKLQSFPIPGSNWEYSFHADLEFENLDIFHHILSEIVPITRNMKIYGIYQKGKTI
ncbi:MAG: chorismate mutase [Pseudopedobacter saltans]|uniref:prephenate dehydratase n=1 Tax=Pseudopedobacter saltans TaxID=151895 RepID=A0A2W5FCE8_9SPHI|nr:MAG: chorismate mutase [Pseudopedobacter saltans]